MRKTIAAPAPSPELALQMVALAKALANAPTVGAIPLPDNFTPRSSIGGDLPYASWSLVADNGNGTWTIEVHDQ